MVWDDGSVSQGLGNLPLQVDMLYLQGVGVGVDDDHIDLEIYPGVLDPVDNRSVWRVSRDHHRLTSSQETCRSASGLLMHCRCCITTATRPHFTRYRGG